MHAAAYAYVERTLATLPPRWRVYEIGGRNVNGSVRPLFSSTTDYFAVDLVPGPGVDVVADGRSYVPPFTPDTIVMTEVLEHSPHAHDLCARAYQLLAEGGVLIITAAGPGRPPHSAHDGGPLRQHEFYATVSALDLVLWLSLFPVVALEWDRTVQDIRALAVKGPGSDDH
jgi:hypothetical protein